MKVETLKEEVLSPPTPTLPADIIEEPKIESKFEEIFEEETEYPF